MADTPRHEIESSPMSWRQRTGGRLASGALIALGALAAGTLAYAGIPGPNAVFCGT